MVYFLDLIFFELCFKSLIKTFTKHLSYSVHIEDLKHARITDTVYTIKRAHLTQIET